MTMLLFPDSRAVAAFSLNFQPQGTGSMATPASNFWHSVDGSPTDLITGHTPYLWEGQNTQKQLPEIVTDPATGITYYHMIIGDLATGFIQESYIQMGFTGYGNVDSALAVQDTNLASASGGTGTYVTKTVDAATTMLGNGYDPLDMNKDIKAQNVVSGNGTGNPTRSLIRTLVSDGQMMLEFLKDGYDSKPQITQLVITPDIQVIFDIDMRGTSYSDNTKTAPIYNTMQLFGGSTPPGSASWDMAVDAPGQIVSGGKFTYTPGSSPTSRGGSDGTYDYVGGFYDHANQDWKAFMSPAYEFANPWSFNGSKVVP